MKLKFYQKDFYENKIRFHLHSITFNFLMKNAELKLTLIWLAQDMTEKRAESWSMVDYQNSSDVWEIRGKTNILMYDIRCIDDGLTTSVLNTDYDQSFK